MLNTYDYTKKQNKSRAVANNLMATEDDRTAENFARGPAAIVQRQPNASVAGEGLIMLHAAPVQLMNAGQNPPAAPQQQQPALNANAAVFVPAAQPQQQQQAPPPPQQQPHQQQQPALNANAAVFVPAAQPQQQQQAQQPVVPPYPNIAHGAPVAANLLGQIGNLPQGNYQIIGQWHHGFEVWALGHGFNGGMIAHFNVQAGQGPMLHVYYNAAGGLEVVPIGQRPAGY